MSGAAPTPDASWPAPLEPEAYHGVLGRLVQELSGRVEPDAPSILIQCLVAAGNVMGPSPFRQIAATRHGTSEFAVIVGKSALARKGTAGDIAVACVGQAADPDWIDQSLNTSGGLSTGEGLILALCEPEADGSGGTPRRGRRLLVIETEFGRVLAVRGRDGNTLSGWLRALWDRGEARIMTRGQPISVQGAHLSVIGHITLGELRTRLDPLDVVNGFGNRILWVCSRRAEVLHDGGPDLSDVLERYRAELRTRLAVAQSVTRLQWSARADAAYRAAYQVLETEPDDESPASALTSRSSAHVLRLSTIYAALDPAVQGAPIVRVPHLLAALAVVRYVGDSVNHIWGGRSLDPAADRVVKLLRESGPLALTALHAAGGRNENAEKIRATVGRLVASGRVTFSKQPGGAGRRPEVVTLIDGAAGAPVARPCALALDAARACAAELGTDDGAPVAGVGGSPPADPEESRR